MHAIDSQNPSQAGRRTIVSHGKGRSPEAIPGNSVPGRDAAGRRLVARRVWEKLRAVRFNDRAFGRR
jgi:hypothetical protein